MSETSVLSDPIDHEEKRAYVEAKLRERDPRIKGFGFTAGTDPATTKEQLWAAVEDALNEIHAGNFTEIDPMTADDEIAS